MLSDNPHSGVYEADTSRTLDCNGGSPACNQGGMMVVEPVYAVTTGEFTAVGQEQAPPLMARDWKDPPVVGRPCEEYLVRRLTPDECCRLQGYPDGWCKDLASEDPNEDEILFWTEVFREWDAFGQLQNLVVVHGENSFRLGYIDLCNTLGVKSTLPDNSTRLPIAFMKSCGWVENERTNKLFPPKSLECLKLTPHGNEVADSLKELKDMRLEEFRSYSTNIQQALIRLGVYGMLERAGYDIKPVQDIIDRDTAACASVLKGRKLLCRWFRIPPPTLSGNRNNWKSSSALLGNTDSVGNLHKS